MASVLREYRKLEETIENMEQRKAELEPQVTKEMEFLDEIKSKAKELNISLEAIAQDLYPNAFTGKIQGEVRRRRPRRVKMYVHPETKEVIETKGGNHKQLKAWKAEYGHDVVEGWVKQDDAA